jgi:AcrR family transcriptional regulator
VIRLDPRRVTVTGTVADSAPARTSTDASTRSRGPGKPSAARDRILATATRLFYGTGIRSVGVDRVIAESQVARMTFFRHFPTKDELVLTFLNRQAELGRLAVSDLRADQGADWPRAVLGWVAAGVTTEPARTGFRGCEFINTAAEFCVPGHPVRAVVEQHRSWIRDLMAEALTELGHPTPQATAELLMMLRTGAVVAASLEGFTDPDGAFLRTWWALVDQR